MLLDLARLALRSIWRRRLRSALTLIGILIGMTAVVALISLGQGLQRAIAQELSRLGYDLILLWPGSLTGGVQPTGVPRALDLNALNSISGVARVGALLRQPGIAVRVGTTEAFLTFSGLSAGLVPLTPRLFERFELQEGRLFSTDQRELILGSALAADLQAKPGTRLTVKAQEIALPGHTVQILERNFTVTGVLRPSRDEEINGGIFLGLEVLYELTGQSELVSLAVVQVREGADLEALERHVQQMLADLGRAGDFLVQTPRRLHEAVGSVLGLAQSVLAGIAAIALLVGCIGLTNTMYTSVLERTHEIGLLKAIGAKRRHILTLFLIEAGLLGLVGGAMGVLLGLSVSQAFVLVAQQAARGLRLGIAATPELVLGALLLSMGLGALSGWWPALRASRLKPVEALHYD